MRAIGSLFAATEAVLLSPNDYSLELSKTKKVGKETIDAPQMTLYLDAAPVSVYSALANKWHTSKAKTKVNIQLEKSVGADGITYYEGAGYRGEYSYRVLLNMDPKGMQAWYTNNGDTGFRRKVEVDAADWQAAINLAEWREKVDEPATKWVVVNKRVNWEEEELYPLPGHKEGVVEFTTIQELSYWEESLTGAFDVLTPTEGEKYIKLSTYGGNARTHARLLTDYGMWLRNPDQSRTKTEQETRKEEDETLQNYVNDYEILEVPEYVSLLSIRQRVMEDIQEAQQAVRGEEADAAFEASIDAWRAI